MEPIERRDLLLGGASALALLATGGVAQAATVSNSAIEQPGGAQKPATVAAPSIISSDTAVPRRAATVIEDMVVNAAKVQAGQRVLILSYTDGLYGGDNLVDRDAVRWIQQAVEAHGAMPVVMWIDLVAVKHHWQFPDEVRQAMASCDRMIYHSFDLAGEEIVDFRNYAASIGIQGVRNFASTAALLCTDWALTPYELVSEIRYEASKAIQPGLKWQITDPNGTHMEGVILPSNSKDFPTYSARRGKGINPFPEWVHPPIVVGETNGVFIFDCMLSWWSRYIGISPYFNKPIRLEIEKNRMVKIEGGSEAESLRRFLEEMRTHVGDGVYNFDRLHFGVHPNAAVQAHQCPNLLYRRLIEHAHTCNLHIHVGAAPFNKDYPYWMHCTGDIRSATFRVGDTLVHDKGRLTVLDSPAIREFAARYPGRPDISLAAPCPAGKSQAAHTALPNAHTVFGREI